MFPHLICSCASLMSCCSSSGLNCTCKSTHTHGEKPTLITNLRTTAPPPGSQGGGGGGGIPESPTARLRNSNFNKLSQSLQSQIPCEATITHCLHFTRGQKPSLTWHIKHEHITTLPDPYIHAHLPQQTSARRHEKRGSFHRRRIAMIGHA